MREALWTPDKARIESAQMTAYMRWVNERFGRNFSTYRELYDWSVTEIPAFWGSLWDYFDIIASEPYDAVCDDLTRFPGCRWFVGAKLNYAENMLRWCRQDGVGIVFRGEGGLRHAYTRREIYSQVIRLAAALREDGVKPGDVVAGYMPNLAQTVMAMLACAAIGAVWCSCATDIGPAAAVDRIGQVNPVVLITTDGYHYKNKNFDVLANAKEIAAAIPSIRRVVISRYAGDHTTGGIPNAVFWGEYLHEMDPKDFHFEQLPADHPLVIMFSSGTTGKPKCMVQSAGGLLINQLKELVLHSNICAGETLLYITTCSWMMWNWQAAALGTGATIVLFDGNPAYPDDSAIWKIAAEEKVTVFGLSASYIHGLMAKGVHPAACADLSALKSVSQTGSALSDEGFRFVYAHIKGDLHFNSIAGGTDINGCFAIGNPTLPVYAGELQAPGLGMKIECLGEDTGKPVRDEQGELVCLAPAPPMPRRFWDDPEGKRYHAAYFEVYPGIWHHGDYVLFHGDTGGVTFYGRSDSILKPSGVRIGTAEIYNQVDKIPEVEDCLAIGQNMAGDQRVLLFVKCVPGITLDADLQKRIRDILRTNASPRHVPAKMIQVPDIPRTLNGKKVESAVTNIVNGRKVTNRDALENPESLDFYYDILPQLKN